MTESSDWVSFDAVQWDIALRKSCLVRGVEVQYEMEDPRPDLIKPIPLFCCIPKTNLSELARLYNYKLSKLSNESAAAARVSRNVATQSHGILKPYTTD